jgi:serine/threonine protein kinase
MSPVSNGGDWPAAVEERYERFEALGKGSFGMVWMCKLVGTPLNEDDDEYVAIKNIIIKNEKSNVYAEREICILQELRHPNIIRLVRAYPEYAGTRVVVMQLARGPNLHQLVVKRGALGLPLCRLVSRQLISAVSYIHGRAVIHRDIKPSNCILACQEVSLTEDYDWYDDDDIWSNDKSVVTSIKRNKWKLMLVDFGFARALEMDEIETQQRHLRNSIVYENNVLKSIQNNRGRRKSAEKPVKTIAEDDTGDNDNSSVSSLNADLEQLEHMTTAAVDSLRKSHYEPITTVESEIMGVSSINRRRESGVSEQLPERTTKTNGANGRRVSKAAIDRRTSTARHKVRSMSALGTKAYAAPEIRKQLRQKTEQDFEKSNAAMTECVADYGMIVDAYSVGWTLRVTMTGVPPNFTISEYMHERENVVMDGQEEVHQSGCCLCTVPEVSNIRIRDPAMLPRSAALLLNEMTEKIPENRMTVREAQNHPYIAGDPGEERYTILQGDYPTKHGDPVVPLKCAEELSKLTVQYHMH